MQTVLLHIEELENENMKKSLCFGVKNTKNLFYVQSSIHVLFWNVFHPKNESMLTVSYYQHIMSVWRDRNMDLKHNQITMRELLKNKQAYSLLYQEFPMFMTPAILQNIRPLTLQQIIQMVRPYISRPKLNMLLEQLENI